MSFSFEVEDFECEKDELENVTKMVMKDERELGTKVCGSGEDCLQHF